MTDSRMRERERLALQGDADAQVQVLVERIRKGELDVANVELAAKLGHEVARKVLPEVSEVKDPITHMCRDGRSTIRLAVLTHTISYICQEWRSRAQKVIYFDDDNTHLEISHLSVDVVLNYMEQFVRHPSGSAAERMRAALEVFINDVNYPGTPHATKNILIKGIDVARRCCDIVYTGSNDPAAFKELHRSFARFLSATGAGRKAKSLAKQSMLKAAADTLLI